MTATSTSKLTDRKLVRGIPCQHSSPDDCPHLATHELADDGVTSYYCEEHGRAVYEVARKRRKRLSEATFGVIRFAGKDVLRTNSKWLARARILTAPQQHVYQNLIDWMWTGEDGAEHKGCVMKHYASVNALVRWLNMSHHTASKALAALEAIELIEIERRRVKDANGKSRKIITSIRLSLYDTER